MLTYERMLLSRRQEKALEKVKAALRIVEMVFNAKPNGINTRKLLPAIANLEAIERELDEIFVQGLT